MHEQTLMVPAHERMLMGQSHELVLMNQSHELVSCAKPMTFMARVGMSRDDEISFIRTTNNHIKVSSDDKSCKHMILLSRCLSLHIHESREWNYILWKSCNL